MAENKDPRPTPPPQNQAPRPQLPTVPANRIIEGEEKFPGRLDGRN